MVLAQPVSTTTTRFIEISTTVSGVITTSPGMTVTTTFGPPITTGGGVETTTAPITLSTIPGTTTTAHVCEDREGMDDPALILDSWLTVSSGDPLLLRPSSADKWSSSPQDAQPVITIDLTDAPNALVYVDSLTLSAIADVEEYTVTVFTQEGIIPNQPIKVEVCYLLINNVM